MVQMVLRSLSLTLKRISRSAHSRGLLVRLVALPCGYRAARAKVDPAQPAKAWQRCQKREVRQGRPSQTFASRVTRRQRTDACAFSAHSRLDLGCLSFEPRHPQPATLSWPHGAGAGVVSGCRACRPISHGGQDHHRKTAETAWIE